MKPIFFIFFLLRSIFIDAQDKSQVTKTRIDTIHSRILNEDRYLYINAPENTNEISSLPVIYVLKRIFAEKTFENRALFLAVTNTVKRDMDIAQIKKDITNKTALIRPSLEMADHLDNLTKTSCASVGSFSKIAII